MPAAAHRELVLVLDFGSQYTQLIARRIREQAVYCEIHPYNLSRSTRIRALAPAAIVLSGGPSSVYDDGAPRSRRRLFELGVPMLGICYGVQLTAKLLGGRSAAPAARVRARDRARQGAGRLFHGLAAGEEMQVWTSHGDHVDALPPGFAHTGESDNCPFSAIAARRGILRHPISSRGRAHAARRRAARQLLVRHRAAPATGRWRRSSTRRSRAVARKSGRGSRDLRAVGRRRLERRGGADPAAIGDRLTCVFVDNGLLRGSERAQVETMFRDHFKVDLRVIDAEERFLGQARRRHRPRAEAQDHRPRVHQRVRGGGQDDSSDAEFLAQGTLYPDVIESVSFKGPRAIIKSHHNVGGLPARMNLALVEPLRELFKDEVRALGPSSGCRTTWSGASRSPARAWRCAAWATLTRARCRVLRGADAIVEEEIRAAGLYESIWQCFGVLLPVQTVGVMGDARTYEETLASAPCIRATA